MKKKVFFLFAILLLALPIGSNQTPFLASKDNRAYAAGIEDCVAKGLCDPANVNGRVDSPEVLCQNSALFQETLDTGGFLTQFTEIFFSVIAGGLVTFLTGFFCPPCGAVIGGELLVLMETAGPLISYAEVFRATGTPMWPHVQPNDPDKYFQDLSGVVENSEAADHDAPITHVSHDLAVEIIPDKGQDYLLSEANGRRDNSKIPNSIDVEWESGIRTRSHDPFRGEPDARRTVNYGPMNVPYFVWPNIGDRLWVNGDWIFDCGEGQKFAELAPDNPDVKHVKTEIHPIRAMATMRDLVHVLPGTGPTPVRVTATDIYISGLGGMAINSNRCPEFFLGDNSRSDLEWPPGSGKNCARDPDNCVSQPLDQCTTPIDTNYEFDICLPPKPGPGAVPAVVPPVPGPQNNVPNDHTVNNLEPRLQVVDATGTACQDFNGNLLMIHATIPLENSGVLGSDRYSRILYAGWVDPPEGLRNFQIKLDTFTLHDTQEGLGDCECTFLWMNLDKAQNTSVKSITDQTSWFRLVDKAYACCAPESAKFSTDDVNVEEGDWNDIGGGDIIPFDPSVPALDFYLVDGYGPIAADGHNAFNLRTMGYEQDCLDSKFGNRYSTDDFVDCYVWSWFDWDDNDPFGRSATNYQFKPEDPSDSFGLGSQNVLAAGKTEAQVAQFAPRPTEVPPNVPAPPDFVFLRNWPGALVEKLLQSTPVSNSAINAIGIDSGDNIYVANSYTAGIIPQTTTSRILVFNKEGDFLREFPLPFEPVKPFEGEQKVFPNHIAIDKTNNQNTIYAVDTLGTRVFKLDNNGNADRNPNWPIHPPDLAGRTQSLLDVEVDSNSVYVAEVTSDERTTDIRILLFSKDGSYQRSIILPTTDTNGNPIIYTSQFNMAVDSRGNIYVDDANTHPIIPVTNSILKFSNDGILVNIIHARQEDEFANPMVNGPTGIAIDSSDNLYVLDQAIVTIDGKDRPYNRILEFKPDGVRIARSDITNFLKNPTDLAINSRNNTYMVDAVAYGFPQYEIRFSVNDLGVPNEIDHPPSDLALAGPTSMPACVPGGDLIFSCTVIVSNLGPGLPRNVHVTDTLTTNAGIGSYNIQTPTFEVKFNSPIIGEVSSGPVECGVDTSTNQIDCAIGTIPVGGTATVTFTVNVQLNGDGDYDNLFTVTSDAEDPQPGNNQFRAGLTIVRVDVKPGVLPNAINVDDRGVTPVAILTTTKFDAKTVNFATICFGDQGSFAQRDCSEAHRSGHPQDVDRDRDIDLLLHYETRQTGIDNGDTLACLSGLANRDGVPNSRIIMGCDAIVTVST